MKKSFIFCERHAEENHEQLYTCSATLPDDDYCAAGHFFIPSTSSLDGRPRKVLKELEVTRTPEHDHLSERPSEGVNTSGWYNYYAWMVNIT